MKLKILAEELINFVEKHPEFADYEVIHSSECGYSGTGFQIPFTIAVPVMSEEFQNSEKCLYIVSGDDGYRTNRAIIDWKFYEKES